MLKSKNDKGNPYHDEEGKFTSAEGQGSGLKSIETPIKLKEGVDLSNFPSPQNIALGSRNVVLTQPSSVEDAMSQGNSILGTVSVVNYAKDTNLGQAFEMNKALQDVNNEFPRLFDNEQLISYGNSPREPKSLGFEQQKNIITKIMRSKEFESVRNDLASKGISLDRIEGLFISNMCLKPATKMYNFKRYSNVEGITISVADKHAGIRLPSTVQINPLHTKHNLLLSEAKNIGSVANRYHLPWGDTSPTYSTCTHELGHHCYNRLQNLMTNDEQRELYDLTKHSSVLFLRGEISSYATTNREEHVAEAFSDYFCNGKDATRHNKDVLKFLKKVYDRIYGSK